LKIGFGLKKDAPIEEIEVDISAAEEENKEEEVADVEGEVEVEGHEDHGKPSDHTEEL